MNDFPDSDEKRRLDEKQLSLVVVYAIARGPYNPEGWYKLSPIERRNLLNDALFVAEHLHMIGWLRKPSPSFAAGMRWIKEYTGRLRELGIPQQIVNDIAENVPRHLDLFENDEGLLVCPRAAAQEDYLKGLWNEEGGPGEPPQLI